MNSKGLFAKPDGTEIIPPMATHHPFPACRVYLNHLPPRPFHVFIKSEIVIIVSCLVWAQTEDEAAERVVEAARIACEAYKENSFAHARAARVRDWEKNGAYLSVEPFDIKRIACQVNWASNGGIAY